MLKTWKKNVWYFLVLKVWKNVGHFLVLKDWKKIWILFSVERLKKQVVSHFSVKRLKKNLGHFLVLKDWKKKLGHFLVLKVWKKSWVELETTFITNGQSPGRNFGASCQPWGGLQLGGGVFHPAPKLFWEKYRRLRVPLGRASGEKWFLNPIPVGFRKKKILLLIHWKKILWQFTAYFRRWKKSVKFWVNLVVVFSPPPTNSFA